MVLVSINKFTILLLVKKVVEAQIGFFENKTGTYYDEFCQYLGYLFLLPSVYNRNIIIVIYRACLVSTGLTAQPLVNVECAKSIVENVLKSYAARMLAQSFFPNFSW